MECIIQMSSISPTNRGSMSNIAHFGPAFPSIKNKFNLASSTNGLMTHKGRSLRVVRNVQNNGNSQGGFTKLPGELDASPEELKKWAPPHEVPFNRNSFPKGFVFGTASAAYQYEGAANKDGRLPSTWDTFTHQQSEKIVDRSNGDVGIDFYHRYKGDIKILRDMGMDAFRFSISWSRILPYGKLSGGVNMKGVNHYKEFIDELLKNGITPFVTLFHVDGPQKLEDDYKGFLSHEIVDDFRDFADICFREFGDKVKHWITFNEPHILCKFGYAQGNFAPGRCSSWAGNCSCGDSSTEPYIVGHNILLAHAAAVKRYRDIYKETQKGSIGITVTSNWFIPLHESSPADQAAAQRAIDFILGWFMDPIYKGDYPYSMKSLVGKRLPEFTKEQAEMLKGSFDFIGFNYYSTSYASNAAPVENNESYLTDSGVTTTELKNGIQIGPQATGASWLYIYPKGLRDILLYVKEKYDNPIIYITENGCSEANNEALPLKSALKDDVRVEFHRDHLMWLNIAIREKVDIRGYFAWSLLDNFEWADGYTIRFGLVYVDYKDGLKRYPKSSAMWFKKFLEAAPSPPRIIPLKEELESTVPAELESTVPAAV